jgi:hypothetical protein
MGPLNGERSSLSKFGHHSCLQSPQRTSNIYARPPKVQELCRALPHFHVYVKRGDFGPCLKGLSYTLFSFPFITLHGFRFFLVLRLRVQDV